MEEQIEFNPEKFIERIKKKPFIFLCGIILILLIILLIGYYLGIENGIASSNLFYQNITQNCIGIL